MRSRSAEDIKKARRSSAGLPEAERRRFELLERQNRSTVFETAGLDHSPISPVRVFCANPGKGSPRRVSRECKSPNKYGIVKIFPKKTGNEKRSTCKRSTSSAVGESRTHTPQRALPPQSSVSTISPLPRMDWDCKDTEYFQKCNFLNKNFYRRGRDWPGGRRNIGRRGPQSRRSARGWTGDTRNFVCNYLKLV